MSSPIRLSCPSCGAGMTAPPDMAGRQARCRKCRQPFRIPPPPLPEPTSDVEMIADVITPPPSRRSRRPAETSERETWAEWYLQNLFIAGCIAAGLLIVGLLLSNMRIIVITP